MGISVRSQALTHVVDELFADLKGNFVFSYLDDLVVFSRSLQEHSEHHSRSPPEATGGRIHHKSRKVCHSC
jgi:hypothetical protein